MTTLEEHGSQAAMLDRLSRVERAHAKAKAELAITRKQLAELRDDETSLVARLELFEKRPG